MKNIFKKPEALNDAVMHYCPGCSHGVAHRLVAEALDHYGITERTVGVAPVGCAGCTIPVTWMMENIKTSVRKVHRKISILRNYQCKSDRARMEIQIIPRLCPKKIRN